MPTSENNQRPAGDPVPAPPDVVAWEEEVAAMTEEEFYKYLEDTEDGLAFGA